MIKAATPEFNKNCEEKENGFFNRLWFIVWKMWPWIVIALLIILNLNTSVEQKARKTAGTKTTNTPVKVASPAPTGQVEAVKAEAPVQGILEWHKLGYHPRKWDEADSDSCLVTFTETGLTRLVFVLEAKKDSVRTATEFIWDRRLHTGTFVRKDNGSPICAGTFTLAKGALPATLTGTYSSGDLVGVPFKITLSGGRQAATLWERFNDPAVDNQDMAARLRE